jgi:hypothetical protein
MLDVMLFLLRIPAFDSIRQLCFGWEGRAEGSWVSNIIIVGIDDGDGFVRKEAVVKQEQARTSKNKHSLDWMISRC